MAYRCLRDDAGFAAIAEKYQVGEMELTEIRNEIHLASRGEETSRFENKLEAIAMMNTTGQRNQYQKAISDIIFNWKEEYRRICRI